MTPDSPRPVPAPTSSWRIFAIPAVLALLGYVLLYGCDARLRDRRGPWAVTFRLEADGSPAVRIDQPALGISNVVVRFRGEIMGAGASATNLPPASLPATVRFDVPRQAVPFGRLAFDDLMYLPGTVVLQCFGHEVQMLPRTLYLNRAARGWSNDAVFELTAAEKPAVGSLAPPPARRPFQGKD